MTNDIRKMMNLFEARETSPEVSYDEKLKAKKVDKVIATLSGNKEKEFSALAKQLHEAKEKLDEIKKLEAKIKGEAREAIAALFDTEDEAYTRLVEISDFSLQLAKKAEPTVTVKYAKVLEELKNHLTPDLIKILNGLEWKFRSVSEKESALKVTPKVVKESENEDFYDKLEDFSDRYHDAVMTKLTNIDDELLKLKSEIK